MKALVCSPRRRRRAPYDEKITGIARMFGYSCTIRIVAWRTRQASSAEMVRTGTAEVLCIPYGESSIPKPAAQVRPYQEFAVFFFGNPLYPPQERIQSGSLRQGLTRHCFRQPYQRNMYPSVHTSTSDVNTKRCRIIRSAVVLPHLKWTQLPA